MKFGQLEKIKEAARKGNAPKIIIGFFVLATIVCLFFYFSPISFGAPKIEYKILAPEYIMSSIYKVYGNPNAGFWASKMILANTGQAPAYDLEVSYKIEGYTDWSEPKVYPVLLPGSTVVDLNYPILSAEICKLRTLTPSNIKIKISYAKNPDGKAKEINESKSINILGGHDLVFSSIPPEESKGDFYDIFSNYPLISAWITPSDPALMAFADLGNKLAGGAGASLSDEEALKSLAGIWEVSVNNGIEYKTEPAAFWTGKFSQFVKYPRDVIKDRAGTCLDTAIFFASAASSQGLKSYVVFMPGHAFPIIQLPSAQMIPVESTALNNKVSFQEAVQSGVETYEKASQGPFIVVDVETFQSVGIVPPELEQLPPDILEKWGISMRGGGGGQTGGQQSYTSSGSSSQSGQSSASYTNSFPVWRVSYPGDWTVVPSVSEVDFYSPARDAEFFVAWGYGMSSSDARTIIEQYVLTPKGAQATGQSQASVGGAAATKVSYQATINGRPYLLYALYFESQGHGFSILYDFPNDGNAQKNAASCESILRSFSF